MVAGAEFRIITQNEPIKLHYFKKLKNKNKYFNVANRKHTENSRS